MRAESPGAVPAEPANTGWASLTNAPCAGAVSVTDGAELALAA